MIAEVGEIPAASAGKQGPPAAATVLIIEDDAAFRDLLAMHLSAAGYKVLAAEDAAVGGRMLLSARPDLLLLDLLLPYLGGLDLLEAMRADSNVAGTPVVCVTSMRDEATYMKATELGVAAFFTKPLLAEELLATVARILQEARQEKKKVGPEPNREPMR
jgi:DNA-binding response OmpR family regulator